MSDAVRLERQGEVGLILVDNPPVSALSAAVRRGLVDAVAALNADASLRAGVLACEGRTFIAGADIREFDAKPPPGAEPGVSSHAVCEALDRSAKPVVAALHGTALGGGLEVALACHARVIASTGKVGLPEVKIGVMPGAGGTQRLPRLTGALAALDIITSGRQVGAAEALRLGIVDAIAPDIRAAAIVRALALANGGVLPRIRDREVAQTDRAEFAKAAAAVGKRARGARAAPKAAEAIGWAFDTPFDAALARERATFMELRDGAQAKALRHVFFAERLAARAEGDAKPRAVEQAGVIGGGTMGSGIAIALADAGIAVKLVEVNDAAVQAAQARIGAVYDRQVGFGRLQPTTRDERLSRIVCTADFAALAPSDLVIEAVVEDMAVKRDVFARLAEIVRADAVLASNTSYLDINRMAEVVAAPERMLGLHFFSPAHVMRLLEIVRADATAPETLATGLALAKRIGKQAVVSGVCDGFIGNRIFARWRQQCDFALEDGALPHEVDAAMEAYGLAMGPFAVGDLAGLDIGWANRKRLAPTRDPKLRYVPVADWICERGRFGQKTGAGYYRHEAGKRVVDPEVTALVERASAERGIVRHAVAAETIQERVHAAMVDEAARILSEGIAKRPSDIDVVLINGYGFPAWRGGPMFEADAIGLREMLRRAEAACAADGLGRPAAPLLRELAESDRTFADLNR